MVVAVAVVDGFGWLWMVVDGGGGYGCEAVSCP